MSPVVTQTLHCKICSNEVADFDNRTTKVPHGLQYTKTQVRNVKNQNGIISCNVCDVIIGSENQQVVHLQVEKLKGVITLLTEANILKSSCAGTAGQ